MNIIGLSAFYHESACCLIRDGKLLAAASEERFTRIKFDPGLPVNAFKYCLKAGNLNITDIDAIAYYESPSKKVDRQKWSGLDITSSDRPYWPPSHFAESLIMEGLGFEGQILFFDHHQSHAASAFYFSPFKKAAVFTADAVGEWTTTAYWKANKNRMKLIEEVRFPHSLGLLYSAITAFLGFEVNGGEYKVMGLAPYGNPAFKDEILSMIRSGPKGQFSLNLAFFDFIKGGKMYSSNLPELFEAQERNPGGAITGFHKDVARSTQEVFEEILLEKIQYLYDRTKLPDLCMAGGVALNCVANSRILRDGPFKRMFVQPAAGDAGGCLGAAALAHIKLKGKESISPYTNHCFFGPGYSTPEIWDYLVGSSIPFKSFEGKEDQLFELVAGKLKEGKIAGWFQGRMEFGPRALGGRSILANPMISGIQKKINKLIKKREEFRPFAPCVLDDKATEWFEIDHSSPFMTEIFKVRNPDFLPGISHINGTARVQTVSENSNPKLYGLLSAFDKISGCPVLLNTSFNLKDEPIVCSPEDALVCMIRSGLDLLVLGDFIIEKQDIPGNLAEILKAHYPLKSQAFGRGTYPASPNLYTFV